MLFSEKIAELKNLIVNTLTPLIDNDYVLLELPYYSNVGDLLIWKGEEDFLKKIPHKCLFRSSFHKFKFPVLSRNTVILLQGGGNWGDVWPGEKTPHGFRQMIAKAYPANKIIVFPQTVFYTDNVNASTDAELFGNCRDLTICARDMVSYNYLKTNFKNSILMLPEMAFCIDESFLIPYKRIKASKEMLYLRRLDCEYNHNQQYPEIQGSYDIADWPTMNESSMLNRTLSFVLWKHPEIFPKFMIDYYFQKIHSRRIIDKGIRFVCQYNNIYTTRLHVAILSVLLGKKCCILDNSYGKNRNFFDTWLKNTDGIDMF